MLRDTLVQWSRADHLSRPVPSRPRNYASAPTHCIPQSRLTALCLSCATQLETCLRQASLLRRNNKTADTGRNRSRLSNKFGLQKKPRAQQCVRASSGCTFAHQKEHFIATELLCRAATAIDRVAARASPEMVQTPRWVVVAIRRRCGTKSAR